MPTFFRCVRQKIDSGENFQEGSRDVLILSHSEKNIVAATI